MKNIYRNGREERKEELGAGGFCSFADFASFAVKFLFDAEITSGTLNSSAFPVHPPRFS